MTFADPPARVARLSVLSGEVGFASAGDETWREASLNRPLITGDRVYTEGAARTELDLGSAALRLDARSELQLRTLDEQAAQFELTEGTLNLTVRNLYDGQRYEIATPTLTLIISEPGAYRVDARDGATQVTVFEGNAEVYGEDDAYQRVTARQSYRFPDSNLRDYEVFDLPRPDDFDDWCFARDERYRQPVARQYVSDEVVGYADLDDYGDWREESDYGPVWYPRRVASEWVPYRDGHWAWVEPWGWTWVDNAPWGFAPSHYGRWVCVRERWGWIPGPARVRPVYAPALVAFIGADNGSMRFSQGARPIGWYPLGPRDVYEPPYHVSRNYFHNVNVTNIHNHTVVNNTVINNVYNNYAGGRPTHGVRHAYRNKPSAVTAVERDTFVKARPSRSLEHDVIMHARPAPGVQSKNQRQPEQRGPAASAERERKSFALPPTPARKTPVPAKATRPADRKQTLDKQPLPTAAERVVRHRPQQPTNIDGNHRRVIEAPTRPTRVQPSSPVQKPIALQAQIKHKETRRAVPRRETPVAHSERRRSTPPPVEPRRDYRQARQTERPSQQATTPPPRQAAASGQATADEVKESRAKTRERPRGMREGARQDAGSAMTLR
ncbi:MAG: FecR domain-containing protein [Gammaproteobacteria bacterium]|nr:FecR domain-containing protein [Gammaproteobacteria bacterium]